jgi:tetratricopeptide (TPR) repeat protein
MRSGLPDLSRRFVDGATFVQFAIMRDLNRIQAMTTDIDALWNFGDPEGSEARFREALTTATNTEKQELATQIARAQGLQQRFADAHATLDAISTQVSGRQRVRYLIERGRILNSAGSPELAAPQVLDAIHEAEACGELGLEIDARHMLGIAAPPHEQETWTVSAIERAEGSDDSSAHAWLGSLLNNLGWIYHDLEQYPKALDCFERALVWHTAHGTIDSVRVARWTVGRALRSCGQVERALAIQEALSDEIGDDHPDGYVFEERAECLLALSREDEARSWFARAHVVLAGDPWIVINEPERLARLHQLSIDQE